MSMIKKITSINEIPFDSYTSDDLVAFDLDDTVFVPAEKIMRSENNIQRSKYIEELSRTKGNIFVVRMFENLLYQLIEEDTPYRIQQLQNRHINTIGLTARRTGFRTANYSISNEDLTLQILDTLGINFESDTFYDFEIDSMSPNNPAYEDDIIDPTSTFI